MKYKSQHFVPKCYLRPFSANEEKTYIVGFNMARKIIIPSASIKNQCAKDYFYDKSGDIDLEFSSIEGEYSRVVKEIDETHWASPESLSLLRKFSYLQHLRTEAMAKHHVTSLKNMREFVFKDDDEGMAWASFDERMIPKFIVEMYSDTVYFLSGLRDCLLINETNRPFITSDNPSIVLNRFHSQKNRRRFGGSGLLSSGWMLVMPISPKFLYVTYDPGVYQVQLGSNRTMRVRRSKDVDALNALQILKADSNIYFSNVSAGPYVDSLYQSFRSKRPEQWFSWTYALEETQKDESSHKKYNAVKTPEEFRQGPGLMHLQSISVNPGIWCSLFQIRPKPRVYDTKSGYGLVRSKELLLLDRLLRQEPMPAVVERRQTP